MKLRYYMRGLGIGILVTALIMGVSGKQQIPLTDAEIKAKAAMLGMVESGSITLSDVQQIQGQNLDSLDSISDEPDKDEVKEASSGDDDTGNMDMSGNEDMSESPEATVSEDETSEMGITEGSDATESSDTSDDNEGAEGTDSAETVTESENTEVKMVSITIKSGSGSKTVCKQLVAAGLIEDANEYDKYLIKNEYATRICVGTYEIPIGSSWEEIAKQITRKK